jgi:DNA invertase Pin-like site-specific DNA recombinase
VLAGTDGPCVDFVFISEAGDTTTPVGRMIFTVLAAVAELERTLIKGTRAHGN